MSRKAPAELVRAAELLERVIVDGAWLDPLLRAQRRRGIDETVRRRTAFCCRIVLEHERGLRALLRTLQHRPPRRVQPAVEVRLLLGLARLLFSDAPDFAVVNDTVQLLPGRHYARGFVNAVLRRAARERSELRERFERLRPEERFSVPSFWCDELSRVLPPADIETALAALRSNPGLHVVLSDEAREALEQRGVAFRPVAGGAALQVVSDAGTFWAALDEGIDTGWAQVQDAGIAAWLDVVRATAPGRRVWDAFCAPGGKLLALARAGFEVVGTDRHSERLRLVREAVRRAGVAADLHVLDVDEALPDEVFDVVLADAPCSASGTLGRHPEVARRSRQEDLERLHLQQLTWLRRVSSRVRPGGWLWYSTCSLFPRENEDVVEVFLRDHPEFARQEIAHPLTGATVGPVRFWPHRDQVAGFTAHALVRTE